VTGRDESGAALVSTRFYRVVAQVGSKACKHCGHGGYWTVAYTGGDGEETEIGTSWADQETAQDVCDLMNMAYGTL